MVQKQARIFLRSLSKPLHILKAKLFLMILLSEIWGHKITAKVSSHSKQHLDSGNQQPNISLYTKVYCTHCTITQCSFCSSLLFIFSKHLIIEYQSAATESNGIHVSPTQDFLRGVLGPILQCSNGTQCHWVKIYGSGCELSHHLWERNKKNNGVEVLFKIDWEDSYKLVTLYLQNCSTCQEKIKKY